MGGWGEGGEGAEIDGCVELALVDVVGGVMIHERCMHVALWGWDFCAVLGEYTMCNVIYAWDGVCCFRSCGFMSCSDHELRCSCYW